MEAYLVSLLLLILAPMATHILAQGSWEILVQNAGIASMHTAVTRFGNVVLLDRTDIGPSQISLPPGECRHDPTDLNQTVDCTAHSVLFTPGVNSIRPLSGIQTDTWCSSGQFFPDGTLVQTGGDFDGFTKVRTFSPCPSDGTCDWVESSTETLQDGRWYATNQLLPDGTQIIVGGRAIYTYEFIPANGRNKVPLPFLQQTDDNEYDNLYPFVHLLPDGNLYIFANRDSIVLNYQTGTVVKTFPTIPGEPRNYPLAGSSVMLPLVANDGYSTVEILVCGGAQSGEFLTPSNYLLASQTCGRIVVTSSTPAWTMSTMPYPRTMGDMVMLPTGDVLIINGAQNGCQGWGNAKNAILNPVLYETATGAFVIQSATTIPRVYHSTANLLSDGRVVLAGSNTHQFYTFTGEFPTELRVEAFSPDYLGSASDGVRPGIVSAPANIIYNETFTITVSINEAPTGNVGLSLMSSPFTTHSFSQGQRMLSLAVSAPTAGAATSQYVITATAPPFSTLAPPAYYMLFAVNQGIPGSAVWIQLSN